VSESSDEAPDFAAAGRRTLLSGGAKVSSEITTPKLIGAFEKRARFRRVESYLILLLMLSLLPLAGYVLSQAKDIAANDTSVDTTARQQKAEGKFSSDAHQLDGLRQQAGSVKITIPFISELDGKLTKEYSANYCRLTLIDAEGNLKSAMDVLSELKRNIDSNPIGCVPSSPGQTIDPGKPHFSLLLFNDNVYANNVPVDVLTFDASLLKDRFSKLINENNQTPLVDKGAINSLNAEYLSSMHTINVDNNAIERLKKIREEAEIGQLTGQPAEDSQELKGPSSLQFLIQLNIVRFGIISLIGIAIGVLAPLYRFSARLAAFYQAKADTLQLHEVAYKKTSFANLSSALTPPMEFGKSQAIPDYLTELLRDSISRGKDDG
jgi:hypothetical protein